MTDKELLGWAAKAVGIEYPSGIDARFAPGWEPLTDDGDALRLVVKLRFELCVESFAVSVRTDCGIKSIENATMGYCIEEATRRAIVRAAAEIGKEMK